MQEPEQEKCGTTHYAGCSCHEQGWENKWKAIRATELKRGDKMRDAAGGAIEVTGAFYASDDSIYVQCGSLSMTIPQNGVVLILPNASLSHGEGEKRS